MKTDTWTANELPEFDGKVAVVTGANSGIGFETVRELARKGAHVVLASRTQEKGQHALRLLQAELPNASLELMPLDLADLASIRSFADEFRTRHDRLDMLVNNAGVMAIPYRKTADGFEMQFGTNHLGHFALTGLLMETLLNTPEARVVTVSSGLHRMGKLSSNKLREEVLPEADGYNKRAAYANSKLANLLFAFELQRQLEAAGADVISVAAHPGYAATNLQAAGPRMENSKFQQRMMGLMNALLAQSAEMGALPTLYAATAPDVRGGDFIGPGGLMEMRGYPQKVQAEQTAQDIAVARRLWELSEELTGVEYELGQRESERIEA